MKTRTIKKCELPNARIGDVVLFATERWKITGDGRTWWTKVEFWNAECVEEEPVKINPSQDDDYSFITSAAVGYATDNAFIGGLVGGDHLGGIVGAIIADSSTPDPTPSISQPVYSAPDPSPILESPDPTPSFDSPSFDPSPSFDSSPAPDSSSFDNSGLV